MLEDRWEILARARTLSKKGKSLLTFSSPHLSSDFLGGPLALLLVGNLLSLGLVGEVPPELTLVDATLNLVHLHFVHLSYLD